MSNMGLPNISQYVLRGCGSSVYSMETAQSFCRQYSIWLRICASVRSGRKEKAPCVSLMLFAPVIVQAGVGVGTKSRVSVLV